MADPRIRRGRLVAWAACLALGLSAPACRTAMVNTPATPVYAVSVTNSTSVELIVSYDDGGGPKALGSVRPGATERFVIAQPAQTRVSIMGRSQSGTTAGPVEVQLIAGQTLPVTLRTSQ